jgi:hypothetical protein
LLLHGHAIVRCVLAKVALKDCPAKAGSRHVISCREQMIRLVHEVREQLSSDQDSGRSQELAIADVIQDRPKDTKLTANAGIR